MRSLFMALAASSIVFGASSAFASVQNLPLECQHGIGAVGFNSGTSAEYDIVMALWNRVYGADFFRANQFIDNVTQTVLAQTPPTTVTANAFLGCRFIGLVDGATRAIETIATDVLFDCANVGINMGVSLASFNCAVARVQAPALTQERCYAVIDLECSVNIDLACRVSFDSYVSNHPLTCAGLASNPAFATFVKNTGCNATRPR